MTYETAAINLAKQLDQIDDNHTTDAMYDQLGLIGDLCGGLSVHGFEADLKDWLDGQASDYVNEIVNYSQGNVNSSLEEDIYDDRYAELAQEWFDSATAIMAQTSQQVAA